MSTTQTVAIAAHRHEWADDALSEISEIARALLHLSERQDTSAHSAQLLARGMLGRVRALSGIASECLSPDENDRRVDDDIARELTGHRGQTGVPSAGQAGPTAAAAQPDRSEAPSPTVGDPIEAARDALAALQAWRVLLPPSAGLIDAQAASTPLLVLRAVIDRLERDFDGPGDDVPLRQVAALLRAVDAELWRLSTFEREPLSVEWCMRVARTAELVLEAAVQGDHAEALSDDQRRLQGGTAFYEMLRKMDAVPDVLRQGFASPDEDDSRGLDHGAAHDLFVSYASRCGITVPESALAAGFSSCLVRYLHTELKGVSLGWGDSPAEDAKEALAEVAESRLGTSLGVSHG